ncbi:MAG TPA: hypothetical protein ACFYD3_03325 [Candidatus Hypogeohydataceae bacterium YC41]
MEKDLDKTKILGKTETDKWEISLPAAGACAVCNNANATIWTPISFTKILTFNAEIIRVRKGHTL